VINLTARSAGSMLATLLAMCLSHAATGAEPSQAPRPTGCGAYDYDISTEMALLTKPGTVIEAAASINTSDAVLESGRTYRVALKEQGQVQLPVEPRRHVLEEGAYAGMVSFKVPADGTWRVSLSKETWAEVVAPDGAAVKSSRFQGREGCPAIRKFVDFPLLGGVNDVLQLSGGTDAEMSVVITGPVTTGP
jgi:hypothetical protein